MKAISHLIMGFILLQQVESYSQLSFTLNLVSSTNSITCSNPSVLVQAHSDFTAATLTYSVLPAALNSGNGMFTFTTSGTYTVFGSAPGQPTYSASIQIGQNLVVPTSTLFPQAQLITCTNSSAQITTVTAISPTSNVVHDFYFANGLHLGPIYSYTAILIPPLGTNTHVLTDAVNGCSVASTFTVAGTAGFPTFSLSSPIQNFSVGCVPKHTVAINFVNANTSPPGAPTGATIFPAGVLNYNVGPITSYTLMTPGLYYAVVKDITTGCETKSPFSINQNTVLPVTPISVPIQTLTCFSPSVLLTAYPQTNVDYSWLTPYGSLVYNSACNVSITSASTNTTLGNYTITSINLINACSSQSILPLYQNTFKPYAIIAGTLGQLTCSSPITFTNNSVTGIPNGVFSNTGAVIATLWLGPNQQSLALSPTYTAMSHGNYTMLVQDQNNGCVNSKTAFLAMSGTITASSDSVYTLNCPGNHTVSISALVMGIANCSYTWSNSSGTLSVGTLSSSSLTIGTGSATAVLQVNSPDYYTLSVQEGGCKNSVVVPVYACVGVNESVVENKILSVFPNPGSPPFRLRLKNTANFPIRLNVYNAFLQKLNSLEITETESNLNLVSEPGVYFLELHSDNQKPHFLKLIVQ